MGRKDQEREARLATEFHWGADGKIRPRPVMFMNTCGIGCTPIPVPIPPGPPNVGPENYTGLASPMGAHGGTGRDQHVIHLPFPLPPDFYPGGKPTPVYYGTDSQGLPGTGDSCPVCPAPPGGPPEAPPECPKPDDDDVVDPTNGNVGLYARTPTGGPNDPQVEFGFNGLNPVQTPLGTGWASNIFKAVEASINTATVTLAGGGERTYELRPMNQWVCTDPPGTKTTLSRDTGTGEWTETAPSGRKWQYDTSGNQTKYTDDSGRAFTYSYSAGQLETIEGPGSRVTTISYDGNGFVSKITDPAGRETEFSINVDGELESYTTPNLCVTSFSYDGAHRLVERTTAEGHRYTFTYETGGDRIKSTTKPGGGVTTYTYTPNANSIEDPLGSLWTISYDASGFMTGSTNP
ncbi:MAG: hypothetical protein GF320_16140, partial [Armatimonadia bacterium]|nr:hypothetical protein [Armatimonadia bacterium]